MMKYHSIFCFSSSYDGVNVHNYSKNGQKTRVQAIIKWHILVESLVISCEMSFCVKYRSELSFTKLKTINPLHFSVLGFIRLQPKRSQHYRSEISKCCAIHTEWGQYPTEQQQLIVLRYVTESLFGGSGTRTGDSHRMCSHLQTRFMRSVSIVPMFNWLVDGKSGENYSSLRHAPSFRMQWESF